MAIDRTFNMEKTIRNGISRHDSVTEWDDQDDEDICDHIDAILRAKKEGDFKSRRDQNCVQGDDHFADLPNTAENEAEDRKDAQEAVVRIDSEQYVNSLLTQRRAATISINLCFPQ